MKKLAIFLLCVITGLFSITAPIFAQLTTQDLEQGEWISDMNYSDLPNDGSQSSAICFANTNQVWIGGDWGISFWSKIDLYAYGVNPPISKNWQHWKFSNSQVSMQGDRVENIFLWKNNKLLIMTGQADTYTDPNTYEQTPYYHYWVYLADPFTNQWDEIYAFDVSHDVQITRLLADVDQEVLYFTQGDFLGKLHTDNSKVDSIFFTNPENDNVPVHHISGVTIDTEKHLWIVGKHTAAPYGYNRDDAFIARLDYDDHTVIRQFDDGYYEGHPSMDVLYDPNLDKLWLIGSYPIKLDPQTGKNLFGHQAIDNEIPFDHTCMDQFGCLWCGHGEYRQGLAGHAAWYANTRNENDDDWLNLHWKLNPQDRVFQAVPRPGTKQVWIVDFWHMMIYTYPSYVGVDDEPAPQLSAPETFCLSQNWPNPFNCSTNIQFTLPRTEQVNLTVFNTRGQQVAQLINNELLQPGQHTVSFNTQNYNLPTGIYFYQLSIPNSGIVKTGKMLLVR